MYTYGTVISDIILKVEVYFVFSKKCKHIAKQNIWSR